MPKYKPPSEIDMIPLKYTLDISMVYFRGIISNLQAVFFVAVLGIYCYNTKKNLGGYE
jgi:hypothetical protein